MPRSKVINSSLVERQGKQYKNFFWIQGNFLTIKMAKALSDMNMKVMASEITKNEHTKTLASSLKKAVGGSSGGPAGGNILQSLYKEKEAKAKTRERLKSEEEEDKKILNFGAFGGGSSMSFGVLELKSDKSIFHMDTSKAMSMLGKAKLCNQAPSLSLSRWRTLTLLKI